MPARRRIVAQLGYMVAGGVSLCLVSGAESNSLWPSDCEMMLDPQSTYAATETICVTGDLDTVPPGEIFPAADIYIVKNRQWQLGDHLVDHFGTPSHIVSTAGAGSFISEVVQAPPLEPGGYDLILDEDLDGIYSSLDLVVGGGSEPALVVVTDALFSDGFEYGIAPWSTVRGSTYGVEVGGIPVWHERAAAALNNTVRMAPQEYRDTYMADNPWSTDGILLEANHPAVEPLVYCLGLNQAARYHANDLYVEGCGFQHSSCDGTPAATRVNSYLPSSCSYSGEALHVFFSDPRRQVNEWLCDLSDGVCCADGGGCDGHRNLLMASVHTSLGVGVSSAYAVQDYAICTGVFRPPLVDGSHILFGGDLLFVANYFDPLGYGPQEVTLVLGGVEHAMSLDTGQSQAGTFSVALATAGQCRSYFFRATTNGGLTYRYPESGQLRTAGDSCTETWVP